jgi:hypothetical protein
MASFTSEALHGSWVRSGGILVSNQNHAYVLRSLADSRNHLGGLQIGKFIG